MLTPWIWWKEWYDSAFTFIYSPRSGTPASKMSEQIDDNIKERLQILMSVQDRISKDINEAMYGKTYEC